jgi:hypothetical protein
MSYSDNLNSYVNLPVLLNCWKHHSGYIKYRISVYKKEKNLNQENILNELLYIGGSLMDLYIGQLSPKEISGSIIKLINKKRILKKDKYIEWLKEEGNDYRIVKLPDSSSWTLRLGEDEKRYIHIHPSRYSPFTIRVRAVSLKTTILYLILRNDETTDLPGLQFLNQIRKEYLNQPPLKSLQSAHTFKKLLGVLN